MDAIIVPMGQHNDAVMRFKTDFGRVFKALSLILHANFETATLIVTREGLFVQESVNDGTMIFECKFKAEKFMEYKIPKTSDENDNKFFTLGFSCADFKQATESINKSDSIDLEIHPSDMDKIFLTIRKDGLTTVIERSFALKATTISQCVPPAYKDYAPTVTVKISEYKKAITSLKKRRKNAMILVQAQEKGIHFSENNSQIASSGAGLGEWRSGVKPIVTYNISLTRLNSFAEVSIIEQKETIRIYAFEGLPLRLSSDPTSLGVMSVYLGSTDQ